MSNSLAHLNNGLPRNIKEFSPHKARAKHSVLNEVELAHFRTTLCDAHQKGQCKNADSCPYSHCVSWQRRNPYTMNYVSKLCPEIEFVKKKDKKMNMLRHCALGKLCSYAHSKEEELYHPLMYKTKMCSSFPNCSRYYCPFAHSKEEIRKPPTLKSLHKASGIYNKSPTTLFQDKIPEYHSHPSISSDENMRDEGFNYLNNFNPQSLTITSSHQENNSLSSSSFLSNSKRDPTYDQSNLLNLNFINNYTSHLEDTSKENDIFGSSTSTYNFSTNSWDKFQLGNLSIRDNENNFIFGNTNLLETKKIVFAQEAKSNDKSVTDQNKQSSKRYEKNSILDEIHNLHGINKFNNFQKINENSNKYLREQEDIAQLLINHINIIKSAPFPPLPYIKMLANWLFEMILLLQTQSKVDFQPLIQVSLEFIKLLASTPSTQFIDDRDIKENSYNLNTLDVFQDFIAYKQESLNNFHRHSNPEFPKPIIRHLSQHNDIIYKLPVLESINKNTLSVDKNNKFNIPGKKKSRSFSNNEISSISSSTFQNNYYSTWGSRQSPNGHLSSNHSNSPISTHHQDTSDLSYSDHTDEFPSSFISSKIHDINLFEKFSAKGNYKTPINSILNTSCDETNALNYSNSNLLNECSKSIGSHDLLKNYSILSPGSASTVKDYLNNLNFFSNYKMDNNFQDGLKIKEGRKPFWDASFDNDYENLLDEISAYQANSFIYT